MLTEPAGNSDLRCQSIMNGGNTVDTAITTKNYLYDIYPAGLSSGLSLQTVISSYSDPNYPMYKVFSHNTGTNINVVVEKIG